MKRIDSFGAATGNEFTGGDPQTGVPATRLSADWLNVVQEELAGTVEAAGLTLDQGTTYAGGHDTSQLHAAIVAIVNSTVSGLTTVPVGGVVPFAGPAANIPSANWTYCDGRLLARASFPLLFAAIGTQWGYTDSTDFRVPDLRGRFIRGLNDGTGEDTGAALRTAKYANGATGDAVGSYQADSVGPHTHTLSVSLGQNASATTSPPAASNGTTAGVNYSGSVNTNTGTESQPKNAAMVYMIRHG